eukprot:6183147-Pleurochrysis_carterae.AAC.1
MQIRSPRPACPGRGVCTCTRRRTQQACAPERKATVGLLTAVAGAGSIAVGIAVSAAVAVVAAVVVAVVGVVGVDARVRGMRGSPTSLHGRPLGVLEAKAAGVLDSFDSADACRIDSSDACIFDSADACIFDSADACIRRCGVERPTHAGVSSCISFARF